MSSIKLVKIIRLLLYCLALTPLIITPMTIFPFNFGRGLITQFLIEIIFFLYLALAIFDKNYRPKKNVFLVLTASFVVMIFISSFFGAHFFRSFWSVEERFTGFFYLLHMFLLFIALGAVFKNKNDWKIFFGANVLVSIAMFGIAILSLFEIKFWGVDLGTRISGTLGNPLFLGAYFIIVLIFALYLGFAAKNFKKKILWFLFAAIIFCGIMLVQSRGALYGTVGGAIIGLLYYGFFNKNKKHRIAALLSVLIIIIAASAPFVFRNSNFIRNSVVLRRVANLSFTAGTGNTRLMGWRVAIGAVKERPLLGWGMEGFDVAFNKYYNPEFLKYSYYETWFDKPHNKILEVAVDGGLVALSLYLLIFAASAREIRKKEKRGELTSRGAAVLIGGLVAYFAQNLFVFDTAVSYLMFFIILAFIASKCREDDAAPEKIPIVPILLFLGLGFIAGWFTNISPFLASAELRGSTSLMELDNTKKIYLDGYKRATRYFNPYKEEWRVDLAKSVILSLKRESGLYDENEINFSIEELKKNIGEYPNNAYYHMLLGGFYAELGTKDKKYFDLAKSELDRALELSPRRQHIYFNYGRLYGLMKDKENLIKVFNKAIELEPEAKLVYWEAGKELYLLDPKDNLISEWIIKAVEAGYVPDDDGGFIFIFKNFYNYFLENKNYVVLENLLNRMIKTEPQEAKWRAQRATVLYLLGDKDEAIAEIKKAMELDDAYKAEGERFMRMIETEK